MPLPAARPCASVVLMLTSAGSTLASIALTSSEPVPGGDVPRLPPPGRVLPPLPLLSDGKLCELSDVAPLASKVRVLELLCTAIATPAPTPADASTSASAARTARPRRGFDAARGAGGSGDQPLGPAGPHAGGGGPQAPPYPALGIGAVGSPAAAVGFAAVGVAAVGVGCVGGHEAQTGSG